MFFMSIRQREQGKEGLNPHRLKGGCIQRLIAVVLILLGTMIVVPVLVVWHIFKGVAQVLVNVVWFVFVLIKENI